MKHAAAGSNFSGSHMQQTIVTSGLHFSGRCQLYAWSTGWTCLYYFKPPGER